MTYFSWYEASINDEVFYSLWDYHGKSFLYFKMFFLMSLYSIFSTLSNYYFFYFTVRQGLRQILWTFWRNEGLLKLHAGRWLLRLIGGIVRKMSSTLSSLCCLSTFCMKNTFLLAKSSLSSDPDTTSTSVLQYVFVMIRSASYWWDQNYKKKKKNQYLYFSHSFYSGLLSPSLHYSAS